MLDKNNTALPITSTEGFLTPVVPLSIPNFPGVILQCQFAVDRFEPQAAIDLLGHPLPPSITASVPKRQAEFCAGRWLAKNALTTLGCLNTEIPIGHHRAPIWPTGFIGSLSHSTPQALCAVGPKHQLDYIGLDIQSFIPTATADSIYTSISTPEDERLMGSLPNTALQKEAFTLLFSAKESLFKALHPLVNQYFDFQAACMVNIDPQKQRFTLQLRHDLGEYTRIGQRYHGCFIVQKNHLLTLIYSAHP